ncbi:MAG: hypothetical protein GY771_15840, partial [bacterium]|nr:hypothetical protein [bacterium]
MKRLLYIFLSLAPPVLALTVTGNENVSEGDIKAALAGVSGEGRVEAVRTLYDVNGYLDVSIEVDGDDIIIVEGPQYSLGEVDLSGDNDIARKDVYNVIGIERGAPISSLTLEQNLTRYLESQRDEGYITAETNYRIHKDTNAGLVKLDFEVSRGTRYSVGEMAIDGAFIFNEELIRRKMETRKGRSLSQNILAADLLTIIDMYRAAGYADAEVRPADFELMPAIGEIDFTIKISENSKVIIDAINLSGNERCRENTILRELTFEEGDPYDINRIRRS